MGNHDPRTANAVHTRASDSNRTVYHNNNLIEFDSTKTLTNVSPGGKYLVMERTDEGKSMENVSPFLLKRVINCVCNEVDKCIKLRNGTILVKTKSIVQAEKLIKLIKIDAQTHVSISEHRSLNTSKGTIFSHDLKFLTDEEILMELKEQNVIGIRRILKRVDNQEERQQTGLFILTFSITELPAYIYAGYTKLNVKPYIPPPLRCMNCLHFGHITSECKKEKTCSNCGFIYHLSDENQKCDRATKCVNCPENHHAFTKNCQTYLKEREIQKIKVIEKVSIREAARLYRDRYSTQFNRSYSEVTRIEPKTNAPAGITVVTSAANTVHKIENNERKTNGLGEIKSKPAETHEFIPPIQPSTSTGKRTRSNASSNSPNEAELSNPSKLSILSGKEKIKILPKKLPARQKRVIKNAAKASKKKVNTKNLSHSDSSCSLESINSNREI